MNLVDKVSLTSLNMTGIEAFSPQSPKQEPRPHLNEFQVQR